LARWTKLQRHGELKRGRAHPKNEVWLPTDGQKIEAIEEQEEEEEEA